LLHGYHKVMRSVMRRAAAIVLTLGLCASACGDQPRPRATDDPVITAPPVTAPASGALRLPKKPGSVRFAVIGDSGRGHLPQYEVSARMQAFRKIFPFDFVVMAGDNVYDGGTPDDYARKFERPYKPLLDAGVKFYAAIGNHDDPNQPGYAPFNMSGRRYYTFTPPSVVSRVFGARVRFFMLDTTDLDSTQAAWAEHEMSASDADWKIPVFHHPLYTSGRYALTARALRRTLEPLFRRQGVVVGFSGHEHFYQRMKPQHGITYFVSGGAGSLRRGDSRALPIVDVGFDQDYHFMLVEIDGNDLFYQAVSRAGETVDSGVIRRGAEN
jgi:Calcineurin-like phosphoesterase